MSVALKNATVREVLNALVAAHGAACWIVEHQANRGVYFGFASRNGNNVGVTRPLRR